MIKVCHLIAEFRCIAQYKEAVGKSLGDIELFFVFFGQKDSVPFSVGRTAFAQVNSHIKHFSADDPHQFSLRELFLEMKSSEDTSFGHALVILDKNHVQACLVHIILIICLHEISSAVAVYSRLNYVEAFDFCLRHLNLSQNNLPPSRIM